MREPPGGVGEDWAAEDRVTPAAAPSPEPARGPFLVHEQGRDALARSYLPPEHALWPGNRCHLLRDGVEAYPAMLAAIRGARRYVRLETYMFIDDAVGQVFARALAEAAGRGVEVTVLYDPFGSWTSRRGFFRELRAQGVDIRAFRPFNPRGLASLFRRDHRKLLIVDGEVAFTGGLNIATHWAPRGDAAGWRDDVLRVEGPVVHQLDLRFASTWRMAIQRRLTRWRERIRRRRARPLLARGDVGFAVLSTRRTIHRAYLHAIKRARRSVLIAAAYFIPDRRLMEALRDAAARGVEVSLILNGKSDLPWLHCATRAFYDGLLAAGVVIREWHGTLHAKTAVVDGTWGTIGSFNLDRISLFFNHEVNLVFADARLGGQLEASFRFDADQCAPIDRDAWAKRPFWRRAVERFLYRFRRML